MIDDDAPWPTDDDAPPDPVTPARATPLHASRPTDRRVPPHDLEAERAALGAAMISADAATVLVEQLTEGDFYATGHAAIYRAVRDLRARDQPIEPLTVAAHLERAGLHDRITFEGHTGRPAVFAIQAATPSSSSITGYTRIVAETARYRRLIALAGELANRAYDQADTEALTAQLTETPHISLSHARERTAEVHDLLAEPEPEYDWIVEGLLERAERVILTGPEGKGKSTLLRQLATQCATGIHPFTGESIPPLRVLIVDLENSRRHVRRKLRPLTISAGPALTEGRLHLHIRPEGFDLLRAEDAAALTTEIATLQPDLLILGPIYKMHTGDPTEETPARKISALLDELRTTHGCALLIEAHTPYANHSGRRPLRPYGASLWSRWPEFGLHLHENGRLEHWRGARDERAWPAQLTRGGDWPWTPAEPRIQTWALIVEETRAAGRQLSNRALGRLLNVSHSTIQRAIEANADELTALLAELAASDDSPDQPEIF